MLFAILLIQPHVLNKCGDQDITEIAVYAVKLQLPCWDNGSPITSCSLPDETIYLISLNETQPGQQFSFTGVPPSLFRLEITSNQPPTNQLAVEFGRPFKLILHADNIASLQFLARQLETFQKSSAEDSKPSLYRQIGLKTSQVVLEIPVPSAVITARLNEMALDATCQFDSKEEKREKLEANLVLNALFIKAEMATRQFFRLDANGRKTSPLSSGF